MARSPKFDFGRLHAQYKTILMKWKAGDEFTSHEFIDAFKTGYPSLYQGVVDVYPSEPTAHGMFAKSLRHVREVRLVSDSVSSTNLQGGKGNCALWRKV